MNHWPECIDIWYGVSGPWDMEI